MTRISKANDADRAEIGGAGPDSYCFGPAGITDTKAESEVFSVVYDGAGDDIYIAYGDVKYKAENADLLEALVSEAPKRRRLQKQPPIGGDERREIE